MDFQTRPAKERAAHYEQEAAKFLRLAEAEPIGNIRKQLAALAEQYQLLATSLRTNRAIRT